MRTSFGKLLQIFAPQYWKRLISCEFPPKEPTCRSCTTSRPSCKPKVGCRKARSVHNTWLARFCTNNRFSSHCCFATARSCSSWNNYKYKILSGQNISTSSRSYSRHMREPRPEGLSLQPTQASSCLKTGE